VSVRQTRCKWPFFWTLIFVLLWACKPPVTTTDGTIVVDTAGPPVDGKPVVLFCDVDDKCQGLVKDPCAVARCDAASKTCVLDSQANGTPCSTGDACVVGQACRDGACQDGDPAPPCTGVVCGTDPCGNICPLCANGAECVDGQCELVSCEGLSWQGCCTADGRVRWCDEGQANELACQGETPVATCGWVANQGLYNCNTQGQASPDEMLPYLCPGESCPPNPCQGRSCGFACGQNCGSCAVDEMCTPSGTCESCACGDKVCGTDPCGASCGECSPVETCVDGSCKAACGDVPDHGCCDGVSGELKQCVSGVLVTTPCDGKSCGWEPTQEHYTCGGEGAGPAEEAPLYCLGTEPQPESPDSTAEPEVTGADAGGGTDLDAETSSASDGNLDTVSPPDGETQEEDAVEDGGDD
jgi:hypothetical protein